MAVEDGLVRATVDVRPYGGPDGEDWFIVSDLGSRCRRDEKMPASGSTPGARSHTPGPAHRSFTQSGPG
ncbi:hypothetical protein SMICM17S_11358 [Streptomyces microflavus]